MKKMSIHLIVAVLFFVASMGINAHAADNPKTINLSFNHIWAPTSGQNDLFKDWARKIEEGTKGKVKITLYPGSTLSHPVEAWGGLKAGAFDIGSCFANYHRNAFEFNKAQLYFWIGAPSIDFAMKEMENLRKKYPILMGEYKDAKVLWTCCQGPRRLLLSQKAVRRLEDFNGQKIRAAIPAEAELVKRLGGVAPPFVPMGQVYPSLQKNMFDGLWVSAEALKSFRLAEVIKYVVNTSLEVGHGKYVAMNWDSWNSLPKEVQDVFESLSADFQKEDIELWTKADALGEEFARAKGVEFISIPAEEYAKFMDIVRPIQDEIAIEMDKKGYPGTALLKDLRDAIKRVNK